MGIENNAFASEHPKVSCHLNFGELGFKLGLDKKKIPSSQALSQHVL